MFFPERREDTEPWFWHIWIVQWLIFFSRYCSYFLISAIFRMKHVVKAGPKKANFGPVSFLWKLNPLNIFQTIFLFARVLPLVRILAILDHIWGNNSLKTSQKGTFHGCWISPKKLKSFNLTTTNAILMKLTRIMYLHENVTRKPLRARNSVVWRNLYEFLDNIKNHHICYALPCVASPVNFVQIPWKSPKTGPKWVLC